MWYRRSVRDIYGLNPENSFKSKVYMTGNLLNHFIRRGWCITILTLSFVALWSHSTLGDSSRPNILFIIADDQSPFDLKAYNPLSELDTPNIDNLAKNGVIFDAAYHMGAWVGGVCTPSRHMVMSGRTVWHIPDKPNRISNNPNVADPELVPVGLENNTMAAVFNRAGYETMRTCKRGNSYEAANAKFTIRKDATKRGGTKESGSAWHADQVIEYLQKRKGTIANKPFLIYFGFSHPHDVRDGTPELLEKYHATNHRDKSSFPKSHPKQPLLPPNYLPEHPFHHGHPKLRDEVNVSGVWERRDPVTIRNEIGRQYACSENIDTQIGRVIKQLKEQGEFENTIIIYTADHGMAIGRHGLQGKQNLYEHTWRVPYIVSGPGIKTGVRRPGNIYLLDTLSTLCDFAGIKSPSTSEGISFKSVLTGSQDKVRDVLYGVYCGGTKPGMRSVRKGDWKLIKYDVLDGMVRKTQLFHLGMNPHEWIDQHQDLRTVQLTGIRPHRLQTNLANHPEYQEKLNEMEALLYSEMKRLNDPYKFWDQK